MCVCVRACVRACGFFLQNINFVVCNRGYVSECIQDGASHT